MDAQHNLSKVLRSIGPKERLAITRNKKVVAEIMIPESEQTAIIPDFEARAKETWGDTWQGSSSEDLLNATREDR